MTKVVALAGCAIVLALLPQCHQPLPEGTPWCLCQLPAPNDAIEVLAYVQQPEFAAFAPHHVDVVLARGAQKALALSTELANDGANLHPGNIRVLAVSNSVELRFTGEEQSPRCFRVDAAALKLTPVACSGAGVRHDSRQARCTYRPDA